MTNHMTLKRLARSAAGALALVGLLAACNSVDEDTTLDEFSDDDEFRAGLEEAFAGVILDDEIDCLVQELVSNDQVSVGEIMDFADELQQSGPVFELYNTAMRACVDPTADVPPVEPTDDQREALAEGFRQGIPGITEEQVTCLFVELEAAGIDARDMVLAGYFPETEALLGEGFATAGQACIA